MDSTNRKINAKAEAKEGESSASRVRRRLKGVKTQQQLELFAEPINPYQARLDAALLRSLHQVQHADKRWKQLRKRGLTDAELKEAISYEFGIYGGGSHPEWHCHQGGDDPKFWLSISHCGKPTLKGQPLIDRVRSLLEIPKPIG
jgi:hypothetical protein